MAQNYAVLADEFVKAFYDFYDNPAKRVGLEQLYHVRLSEYLSMVVFNRHQNILSTSSAFMSTYNV